MAKHGFTRPSGWHQEVGQCWGSRRGPWERPEGKQVAQEYIDTVLTPAIASRQRYAQQIEAGNVESLTFTTHGKAQVIVTPDGVTVKREWSTPPETHAAAAKAAAERWEQDLLYKSYDDGWRTMTTWDRARKVKVQAVRLEAAQIETEAKFQMRAIGDWKPGVLKVLRLQRFRVLPA